MKKKINLSLAVWTVFVSIIFAMIVSWGVNIYKLLTGPMEITGEFILRIIGIFVGPIGSVMGLF